MQDSSAVRQILCLNVLQPQDDLIPVLRSSGWDPVLARDPNAAQSLIDSHRFRVGLVEFDPVSGSMPNSHTPELFEGNGSMEWVGVLPKHAIGIDPVSRLIRDHFFDFHTLPIDVGRLTVTLGHAYGMACVKNSVPKEAQVLANEFDMVGQSPAMQALFHDIRKIAATDVAVLIAGESGTGKELAANAIHKRSRRRNRPFVVVNCGSLPSNLIQSELFGYEKGAFTGANQRHIGFIETAIGGTIFLDEIGDLPLDLQTNLLRFLQEGTINRVGGTEHIPVDVRVIAATHIDLEKAVAEGRFREDLYYRLNVLHLTVPPLRERGEDIEVLARFLFQKFASEKRAAVKGFSQEALRCMNRHTWPGNVRELVNRVRRAAVMCENHLITPKDLGLERRSTHRVNGGSILTLDQVVEQAKRDAVQAALNRNHKNVAQAARELGISRVTLYRLMGKNHIPQTARNDAT